MHVFRTMVWALAAPLFVGVPAGADTANAECWAYHVEVYDAASTLEDSAYGSYCWTSNPAAVFWQYTPASQQQHQALAQAHALGAPEVEHHTYEQPLADGGYYLLDGYRIHHAV